MGKRFDDEKAVEQLQSVTTRRKFSRVLPQVNANSSISLVREFHLRQVAEMARQNQALRESLAGAEELCRTYTSLLDIAQVGFFVLTADGHVAEINRHAASSLGDEPANLIGRHFSTLVSAEHTDCWRQLSDGLAHQGARQNTTLVLRRADGTMFSATADGMRVMRDGLAMLYIMLTMNDAPCMPEIQKPSGATEAEPATFYVFVLPREGAMYIEYLSANAEALLEVPEREAPQDIRQHQQQIHFEDRAGYREEMQRSKESLAPFSYEYRIIVASGKLKWLRAIARPFARKNGDIAWFGILLDITAQKRSAYVLEQTRDELRAMMAQVQLAREEERARIARDLHDELGQELTALKMDIEWLKGRLRPTQEALLRMADELVTRVDGAIGSVRRVSSQMRPMPLEMMDLSNAIEWLVAEFEGHAGIRCKLTLPDPPCVLSEEQATYLYRICQELLTNIVRHAKATCAVVILQQIHENIILAVADDGCGIRPLDPDKTSLGLRGVRERVQTLGGIIDIATVPEILGTRIIVRIPQFRSGIN